MALTVNYPNTRSQENKNVKLMRTKSANTADRAALGEISRNSRQTATLRTKLIAQAPKEVINRRVQPFPIIPPGVPNIDDETEENTQLCVEYAPLMYSYLRQLEAQQSIKRDFLKNCHVNGKMRGVLLDWLIEVHNQFKLLQETLYMTIFIIDRYLQADGLHLKRNKFQLLGVTCMFTASKVEEMYAPEINDFVYITDNAFSAAEIRQMEIKVLSTLNFALGRPLPLHFLRRNSKAGDVDILQHTLAKYIIEICQLEYDMAHIPPSQLAASSLYLSLLILTPDSSITGVWTKTLEYYSNYEYMKLLPIVCKMAAVILRAGEGKLKAVYSKYSTKKMLKVAEMPELKGSLILKLANKHLNSIK